MRTEYAQSIGDPAGSLLLLFFPLLRIGPGYVGAGIVPLLLFNFIVLGSTAAADIFQCAVFWHGVGVVRIVVDGSRCVVVAVANRVFGRINLRIQVIGAIANVVVAARTEAGCCSQ